MPNERFAGVDPRIRGLVTSMADSFGMPMPGSTAGVATKGIRQVLPSATDAIEMLKRLQGGLSRVPMSVNKLIQSAPINQSVKDLMHPSALQMQEQMYQEANPIFRQLQQRGLFDRFSK